MIGPKHIQNQLETFKQDQSNVLEVDGANVAAERRGKALKTRNLNHNSSTVVWINNFSLISFKFNYNYLLKMNFISRTCFTFAK